MNTEAFRLGEITMYVSEDHRFGTDAFLLANYAGVRRNSVVCDLCTGCGIIPLIFCKNIKPRLIYAVEIQQEGIELLKRTISENNLDNIKPVQCDLKELSQNEITFESVDIVTVNPPYMKAESGLEKLSYAQAVARHEILCNVDDVVKAASKLLKYGGTLKMCNMPDRLADVIAAMRKYKIEPKSLTMVHNKIGDKPWLFLISGKKGAASGMTIEKPIVLRNDDNTYTEEYTRLYEL